MKERVTKIFFERRTWSFWPFFLFFVQELRVETIKKPTKTREKTNFFISFLSKRLYFLFSFMIPGVFVCVCVWLSDRVGLSLTNESEIQTFNRKRDKNAKDKKNRFIVCVCVCVRRCRDRQIIMWSGVMVSLSSSVPVVKMEGLVKLCAESLHFVLLGLCTR